MKKQPNPPKRNGNVPENDDRQVIDELDDLMSRFNPDIVKHLFRDEIKQLEEREQENYNPLTQVSLKRTAKMLSEGGKVTEAEWFLTHPFGLRCGSDKFYASIATELLLEFCAIRFEQNLPEGVLRSAAMSITAYLEDLVTGTGIWDAVRSICLEQNGGALPFYEVDPEDYFDDDLNIQDIMLLVWQAFNRIGHAEGRVFSPLSQAVRRLSELAYDKLIDNFDKAPRATRVADKIRKAMREGSFIDMRTLGHWLSVLSPLTAAPYAYDNLEEEAHDLYDQLSDRKDADFEMCLYIQEAKSGWTKWMSLNGCSSAHLLSVMADKDHHRQLAYKLRNLKVCDHILFTVEGTTKTHVIIKDQVGRTFNVVKDSFASGVNWNTVVSGYGNFVKFGDEYYQSGMAGLSEEMPREKEKIPFTGVTDDMLEKTDEIVRKNRGRRLVYCKNFNEVSKYMPYNLPIEYGDNLKEDADMDVLLILSSTDGPILRHGACGLFKDKANPFYAGDRIADFGIAQFSFLSNSDLPDDAIDYIASHKLLPKAYINAMQGKRVGKAIIQDNMAFLMRFYRVESYRKPYSEEDDYDD